MNIKKHIPNLLTLGNLLCGCLGIYVASKTPDSNWYEFAIKPPKFRDFLRFSPWSHIGSATMLLLLGLLLDFFDGFVARLLKVNSEIGKQLDSLADQVTFGVLPGFIMFYTIKQFEYFNSWDSVKQNDLPEILPYFAFLIPLFAALRLAKFNIDTEQTSNFKGLATPSVGLFVIGLVYFYVSNLPGKWVTKLVTPYTLAGIVLFLSAMMVAPVSLFGFKFKNYTWKDNWFRYVLLGLAIPLLIWLQLAALPVIILLYILMSVLFKKQFVNTYSTE